ncbi:MAG: DnaB-like helicase N-terminal domain-containing protein, partial [Geobacteraceae bacterium]
MNAAAEGFIPVFVTHARESEQTILGGLMMAPQLFDIVGDIVQAGDFFTEENQRIFTAVSGLINSAKDCDVITVWEHLKKEVEIEHLHAMVQYVPSPANARKHAQ